MTPRPLSTETLHRRWNMRARLTPKHVSGTLLRILILASSLFATAAIAGQITVPNGDFSSATNANAGSPIGGGLLTAPASGVAIGTTGPWTGTYAGAVGVVAPPQLQIDSGAHVAEIDGILGLNVLGSLVANSGSFNQIFPTGDSNNLYLANKVYTLSVHVDASAVVGVDLLSNGIFGAALTATNGATTNTVATSSTNPATLVLLSTGHYQLSLPFATPASGPPTSRRIGVSLFSHPQGLASLSLLPTIQFSDVTLNRVGTIPSGVAVTIGSQSGTQSATVGQPFTYPLSVTVVDSDGDAVPGVTVTFAAPGAGASAALSPATPVVTDASGVATVDATANTVAGGYSVSATVAGVATPATFDLTNVAAAPDSVTIVPPAPASATVGTAFAALVVQVKDVYGNLVSDGITVTANATTSAGGASTQSPTMTTTTSGGGAQILETANTIAGSYQITVSAGAANSAPVAVTNTAGAASKVKPGVNGSLAQSGSPQSATVGTAFTLPLSVLVTDQYDNPVSGATVTFTPPASGASAGLSSNTPTTNASGVAAVTATANNIAGLFHVPATVAGGTQTTTFDLTSTAGPASKVKPGVNGSLAQSGSPQSATVGTQFTLPLTVLVTDQFDNPVSGATVTFTPPASGASAGLSNNTPTTNASGVAAVTATANNTAGLFHVPATVAGGTQTTTFDLTSTAGAASKVKPGVNGSLAQSGSPQSATVGTQFSLPLTVLVTDQFDNPVSGATVTFTPPASGASAGLSSNTPTTNASGVAAVTATANNIAGLFHVPATVAGGTQTTTFDLTSTAGPASKVKPGVDNNPASSGTPQSAIVTEAFALPLTVLVTDAFDNPVSGATVSFAPPQTGASALLSNNSAATNANGVASVTATANSQTGLYHIPATVVDGTQSLTFDLTNTAAATTGAGGTPQATVAGTEFDCALIAKVSNVDGPVAGIGVQFTAIPAGNGASATFSSAGGSENTNPLTINTDVAGFAAAIVKGNLIAGTYNVTAGIPGTGQTTTYRLTNLDVNDPIFKNGFEDALANCAEAQ
jgi:hypothetical protein